MIGGKIIAYKRNKWIDKLICENVGMKNVLNNPIEMTNSYFVID